MKSHEDYYELCDSGNGEKLERFGQYLLRRPAAQAVWPKQVPEKQWQKADAAFDRRDGNRWRNRDVLPERWQVNIADIRFHLSGTDFGHLGVFPEQREQWIYLRQKICELRKQRQSPIKILNLFAYSGGATLACAMAGAELCHLDASKGMVEWARENASLNRLDNAPIRWICDDVRKFLQREARRKRQYDAVILDPPSFGRGKNGETYKIEEDIIPTLIECKALLSPQPAFVLLSAHTPGFSPQVLENQLRTIFPQGKICRGEMLLTGSEKIMPLPSGAWARWEAQS